jgi:tRNA(fMet)-specific endonuclease VapC
MSPKVMLDTNICIYLINNESPEVAEKFAQYYRSEVVMSSITLAELEFGNLGATHLSAAEKSRNKRALKSLLTDIDVLSFDASAAVAYAQVRFATKTCKSDALDKLIAAHAISLGITLITNNVADFSHYPGLRVENWLTS